jgi:hypothetical protein
VSTRTKRRTRARRPRPRSRIKPRRDGHSLPTHSAVTLPDYTIQDLAVRFRVGRQTLWAWRKDPAFPAPYFVTPQAHPLWRRADIDAFIEARRADRVSA